VLLKINNLSKHFGGVKAVQDVSLQLDTDQIVSIIGPNGAGKTTIFNLISGIYEADQGDILLNQESIVKLPQHVIAGKGISRTFQNIRLFKGLTCVENVMVALDAKTNYSLFSAMLTLPSKRRNEKINSEKARYAMELVGMEDYCDEDPHNLAYGMQRRIELARAIVNDPILLMLDEPAAGLNPSEVSSFIHLLADLKEKFHFGVLVIEHRMQVVNDLSDYIYVLNFGNLLTEGTPAEVQENPDVIKAYIGEADRDAED
jgi:branched-chain amino acid transport system ATP-binding protein